jgi:hypothetical protein
MDLNMLKTGETHKLDHTINRSLETGFVSRSRLLEDYSQHILSQY